MLPDRFALSLIVAAGMLASAGAARAQEPASPPAGKPTPVLESVVVSGVVLCITVVVVFVVVRERRRREDARTAIAHAARGQCKHEWEFQPLAGVRLTMKPGHSPPRGHNVCRKCGAWVRVD